jgi:beta-lactamase class A
MPRSFPSSLRRARNLPGVVRTRLPFLAMGLLVTVGLLAPSGSAAQEAHLGILAERLQNELEAVVHRFDGVAGIHVVDLTDGRRFDVRGDLIFPQASAIKITILLELFRRAETDPGLLRKRVELTEAVRTGGSGVLNILTDGGSALSLEDHAIYMIVYSDNTSTNVLLDELGMAEVNALAASLGAPQTIFQRKMIQPEASARGDENLSTPREAARIMERIAACELPMSTAACARVTEILALPKGGPARAAVPASIPIAFKPGGIAGVATVWAVVQLPGRPYVLSVMANYGGDGGSVVREASEAAYSYFSKLAGATPYGTRVPLELLPSPSPPNR